MATIYDKIGKQVRKYRKSSGLSQEKLSELIGRDVRTIVAIESGKRNPTLKTLKKIASVLKTKLSNLVD